MKYANTKLTDGVERVVTVLPLSLVPLFDPNSPIQANTYGVSDDVQVGWEKQSDGSFAPHQPTAGEILAGKKEVRRQAVEAITVTTGSGKTFNGDETSQNRMTRAILTAGILSMTETTWVLANNVPTTVTLAELQEALALAMQAQGAVWAAPYS